MWRAAMTTGTAGTAALEGDHLVLAAELAPAWAAALARAAVAPAAERDQRVPVEQQARRARRARRGRAALRALVRCPTVAPTLQTPATAAER